MKFAQTSEYPTRYYAFDNSQTFVEQIRPSTGGGFEFAVYSHSIQNKDYPHLKDGVYAEIVSYQGKGYLWSVHATKPDKRRNGPAFSKGEITDNYQVAVNATLENIQEAEEWVKI